MRPKQTITMILITGLTALLAGAYSPEPPLTVSECRNDDACNCWMEAQVCRGETCVEAAEACGYEAECL